MDIGIIGLGGDMGRLYAGVFSELGYNVCGCDLPEKRNWLEQKLEGTNINILDDGVAVSQRSDSIIYSVEAENIKRVVQQYGPSTKKGAIVAGQTSVKTPEIEAFEKYLPKNVHIVTCHSLHGPDLSPKGQTLIAIKHRSSNEAYKRALETFKGLGSNIVEIPNYLEHDRITADTMAATHVGFESMGTAWKNAGKYPWENPLYTSGIDNVKILLALRIYGGKSHVYAGLAMLNPFAKKQIRQYAKSELKLSRMMARKEEKKLRKRMEIAADSVFGNGDSPILLDDKVMREFSLGTAPKKRMPNSHISLLAMVDAWHKLKINPYKNMICQTPPFRLRLGIAEYLFRNPDLLEESLQAALYNDCVKAQDLFFHFAVKGWAKIIRYGTINGYKQEFEDTSAFFKKRLPEAKQKSTELIRGLTVSSEENI